MATAKRFTGFQHWYYWLAGLAAFLWVLIKSGTNPKRLAYPCQRAAMPVAFNWLLATIAFFTGNLLFGKFARISGIMIIIIGTAWFVASIPDYSKSNVNDRSSYPAWVVNDPISTVFILDSIPPTSGSVTDGNASVSDEHLPDPAIDTLMLMLEKRGIYLHRTAEHPEGIVEPDNIVIIKGNFQWTYRNTTSTDRIKGLIWQILNHPDGFTGEIIVCDNIQNYGVQIGYDDNNSEDMTQNILDVISTFYDKGYPVYLMDWSDIWSAVADEYSEGDYLDGYIYEDETMISYPKFKTPSTDYYVSLRYGIWDSLSAAYDSAALCIIDFPVLKGHSRAGATVAVKNWVGVMTTAYSDLRYGGIDPLHDDLLWSSYALVARIMAVTYPDLTVIDATWTSGRGPNYLDYLYNTNTIIASTDPVAASWYAAKFILTPVAVYPYHTDPDAPGSVYGLALSNWTTFLADSAGYPCTMDSAKMSIHGRSILIPEFIEITEGPHVTDTKRTFGVCFVDYNQDGYPDLYVAGARYPEPENNCLYQNNGDGTFFKVEDLAIVNDDNFSMCAAWADYDNDDDLDCFVASHRTHPNIFYVNDGAGSFAINTTTPLDDDIVGSTTASWIDFNLDGDLDLFVGNSTGPMSGSYPPYRNFLFQNNGGIFTEITTGDIVTRERHTYGASWCDFDNDGDQDLVVPNNVDEYTDLYRNDGDDGFTLLSSSVVCQSIANGGGSSWSDYDNDGDMDLFIGSYSPGPSRLYQNNGDGTFSEATDHGLGIYEGRAYGGLWGDYDNDGDEDIYVWLCDFSVPAFSKGFLFKNNGNGSFVKLTEGAVTDDTCTATTTVWGDYDRDGFLDLYFSNHDPENNYNPLFLRNQMFRNNGNDNNWITIKPVGTNSNRSAVGAKVRIKAIINGSPVWQMREITTQTAISAQPPLEVHFGLGDATIIDSIRVEWPSGLVECLTDIGINQFLTVTESMCGDVDNSGAGNILDITFLISYLYKDGPEPEPLEIADVDGSETINILDITYMINFLYKDGPEPNCFN